MSSNVKSIDGYLAALPGEQRAVLEKLRARIGKAVPDAEETISYRIPTFKYRGRPLLYFAAFKDHCSLYPCTEAMMDACGEEIGTRRTGKGTIQFTTEDPLPARLVAKLARIRRDEIDGKV